MPIEPGEETEVMIRHRPELHALHAYSLHCPHCSNIFYLHRIGRMRRTCQACRRSFRFYSFDPRPTGNSWIARARCMGERSIRRRRQAQRQAAFAAPVVSPALGVGRRFGVEIEIAGLSEARAAQAITSDGGISCQAEHYGHSVPSHWKSVHDGSVSGGCEVVSPPLRAEVGFPQIAAVCRALAAAGATVNRTCGLHVHIEVVDLTPAQICKIARYFQRMEGALDSILAPSRRGSTNIYCQSLTHRPLASVHTLETLRNAFGHGRYFKVNVMALSRQNTLEFRAHQGTVDATKITMWVQLLFSMIEDVLNGTEAPENTLESLLANKAEDLRRYYTRRAAHFARGRRAA